MLAKFLGIFLIHLQQGEAMAIFFLDKASENVMTGTSSTVS